MMKTHTPRVPPSAARTLVCACAALLLAGAALAQADPKEALRRQVGLQLETLLPNGAGDVVTRLQNVKPNPNETISRGFNLGNVNQRLFGRLQPTAAPDCQAATTPAREPDEGMCVMDRGRADDPTGDYKMLAFSKNIGQGDIRYFNRQKFDPRAELSPTPVKLDDRAAYEEALKFVALLGVPASEIPRWPAGASLPVRTLAVGSQSDKGNEPKRIDLLKVVSLPRAFEVPGGLLRDPATGRMLNHVLAPGQALVALSDSGVQFARIEGWSDAQMDPRVDPRQAKSQAALLEEITEDLYNEGVRRIGMLSMLVTLRRAYPNPDDPNPPLCPVCGLLRPALEVRISTLGPNRADTSEARPAPPGLVREYDLVNEADAARAVR